MMNRNRADDSPVNEGRMLKNTGECSEKGELPPSVGIYECYLKEEEEKRPIRWGGMWRVYDRDNNSIELDVQAGGYAYWLVVGKYVNGHYLCIPEWNVGCPLSQDLQDRFWNYRSLSKTMEPFHAMGVVRALEDFSLQTGWGHR